jgi:nucleotide-binding universal stress UspA family protein
LVGIDVSAHRESLTGLAVRWSRRFGARLVGLGIVDEPGIRAIEPAWPVGGTPGKDPVYYAGYESRLAGIHQDVDRVLADFQARCAQAEIDALTLKRVGSPATVLEQEAQVADLVLLPRGSRFRFTNRDHEPDDTVRKVLKNAPRPIVVVPATPVADGPIVIAYDGSLQAARALAAFEATGLGESGQVHIVCATTPGNGGAERAKRARQFLSLHKIEATVHMLESGGPPAPMILERVKQLGAGLLVMGAYGQPKLREFVIGSVTRTILEACPVPLLLYH